MESVMKLPKSKEDHKALTKKLAFIAVFGVTGIVAVATYKYMKKQLSFEDLNWDDVWKGM
jgi:hypothetical protein